MKSGVIQKQIQGRRIPPDSHLTIALKDPLIASGDLDPIRQRVNDPLKFCLRQQQIDVDVDRASHPFGTPGQRPAALRASCSVQIFSTRLSTTANSSQQIEAAAVVG